MLVMKLNEVQMHFHTPYKTSTGPYFNHVRAPFRTPGRVLDTDIQTLPQVLDEDGGSFVCIKACIGLSYNGVFLPFLVLVFVR